MLSSFPKSYEPFVIAIEARDELPKPQTLKTKLIEEGRRHVSDEPKVDEVAFFCKHKRAQQPVKSPNLQRKTARRVPIGP